jgi:hypothetical protein
MTNGANELGDGRESDADRKQDRQIEAIRKRSTWAIALSILAPLIAFGSCAAAFLQWKAAAFQNDIMAQQTDMMRMQLKLMSQQLADARSSAAENNRVTDQQLSIANKQAESLKFQAETYRRQLRVAENDAATFREQAAALASEVEVARRGAEAMNSQAASMKVLANSNQLMAAAANVSAEAAKKSAQTSAQQLEVTDRALIKVSASMDHLLFVSPGQVAFTSELKAAVRKIYGEHEVGAVVVSPVFAFRNDGRSVANSVRLAWKLVVAEPADLFMGKDVDKRATDMCDIAVSTTAALGGRSLFPNDKVDEPATTAELVPVPASTTNVSVQLYVMGCVTYQFANSLNTHRTWFTYRVSHPPTRTTQADASWSFKLSKGMVADVVLLEKHPHGGNGAD